MQPYFNGFWLTKLSYIKANKYNLDQTHLELVIYVCMHGDLQNALYNFMGGVHKVFQSNVKSGLKLFYLQSRQNFFGKLLEPSSITRTVNKRAGGLETDFKSFI